MKNLSKYKYLLLIVTMISGGLKAQYSPVMRMNFGASHALLRLQAGYFMSPLSSNSSAIDQGSIQNKSMISGMRLNMEAMVLLNNRGRFSESVSKTAPRLINFRTNYDGFMHTVLSSVSYAQGIPCMTFLPIFGQVKGYWSTGAASRLYTDKRSETMEANKVLGARVGFNCYNKRSAMQSEVYAFSDKVIVNVLVYKKLGEHILIQSGVEYNKPLFGLSILAGNCRFTANTRYINKTMQHGISFTSNF